MKVLIFAILSIISVVSCEFSLPIDAEDAIPYEQHPRMKEIIKVQYPELLEGEKTPFIIGGSLATLGQFPHQALILIYGSDGYTYLCGGTIIRHNWVLTAGHCVYESFRRLTIYLGVIDSIYGPAQWGVNVTSRSDVKLHSGYVDATLLNDIALIRLPGAPENLFSAYSFINNITLPVNIASTNLTGTIAEVSGFGRTSDIILGQSQYLKYVSLPIVDVSVCNATYSGDFMRDSLICANTTRTASTCSGDSGGPLTSVINGNRTLVGVVSFGAAIGCEYAYPVGFTRVSYYMNWITDTVNMSPKSIAVNAILLIIIQIFLFLKR